MYILLYWLEEKTVTVMKENKYLRKSKDGEKIKMVIKGKTYTAKILARNSKYFKDKYFRKMQFTINKSINFII